MHCTAPTTDLSGREQEVLIHWLGYATKQEVARELFITECTVHTHLARIRDKYSAAGRPATSKIALLIRAIEDGLCTLDDIAAAIDRNQFASSAMALERHIA
ncbi:DNA-binding response regulator [Gordonia sp. TBRC 11910]|uniref:DNA-binding response regulator n=1 Tax=Gordonia asplenii TaxID=2725283 RepID=A0A848L3I3_9ACTN|nr:LuxR C-terminal-related transcriptional regulator [Gordonia asplenii]NMO05087.1 DNA-binding response regulator [Gordonia asplenii]